MAITYSVAQHKTTGQLGIFARDGSSLPFNGQLNGHGAAIPVAMITKPDKGFPLDAQQVAQNVADLLNGNAPTHRLSSGDNEIFYSRTGSAVVLRLRPAREGVSVPAMAVVISDKGTVAKYGQEALARMDADFMTKICDSITIDPAAAAPQQKGTPPSPRHP